MCNNPIICIPLISTYVSKRRIADVFKKLNIGPIAKIVMKTNQKSKSYKVFIHLRYWYISNESNKLKDIINNGGFFNVVHSFPKYWKCFKSKV